MGAKGDWVGSLVAHRDNQDGSCSTMSILMIVGAGRRGEMGKEGARTRFISPKTSQLGQKNPDDADGGGG